MSKQQIQQFNSQEVLQSLLIPIEKYSGVRNGKIGAEFYDDCQNIPDPSAMDPTQKNLLLLDDCFLGKQNKAEAYYTRGRHNNCDTIYIAQNYFRLPRHTIRENSNLIILFHKTRRISLISMLTIVQTTYPCWKSNSFVMEYGVRNTTLLLLIARAHQRMESIVRIVIDSISQLVLYKATWKHTNQSPWKRLENDT